MLKTVLETLDGVDDALKPFYTETDGKHVLQIEGVDSHPDVANLKSAYERTKDAAKSAKDRAADLEKQIAEMSKGKPDEAATLAARKQIEDELATARKEAETLRGQLTGVTRDRTLEEALTASGVANPAFRKAAMRMLSDAVKVEGGNVMFETDMGPMPVADYVKRWAAGEGKDFVSPASGGGAKGSEGGTAKSSIKRSEYEAMTPADKHAAMKSGAKITD